MEKEIENYIIKHSQAEDPVLKELARTTYIKMLRPRMLSGHLLGNFLAMMVYMIRPKFVLEIGTFTGYSAICMAKALPNGSILHTIEIDDELEAFVRHYFVKANVEQKINLHIGHALNVIPAIDKIFDLVFIDADKTEYLDYYKAVYPKLRNGGFIIADNALWDGKVVKPIMSNDKDTKGIIAFNRYIQKDNRVENMIFPLRDGLMLIRKK